MCVSACPLRLYLIRSLLSIAELSLTVLGSSSFQVDLFPLNRSVSCPYLLCKSSLVYVAPCQAYASLGWLKCPSQPVKSLLWSTWSMLSGDKLRMYHCCDFNQRIGVALLIRKVPLHFRFCSTEDG